MMRKLLVLLLASLLVVLVGCGGDDEGAGDGTEVTVWDRAGATANTRQKFFERWNAEEGKKLGIRVKYVPQATEKYEEIVRLGFQTRRAPDLFHAPSSQMGAFVAAGWVQPLEGLVDDAVLQTAEPYLQPSSELVWGGKKYAIPSTTFTNRLLYNKDLFRKAGLDPDDPPTTLSEVEDAARAITEKTDAAGIALSVAWVGFRQWKVDIPLLAVDESLAQNGLFDRSTGKYRTTEYAPVVEHYQRLIADKLAYPGAATLDYDATVAAFADGKVAMVTTSSGVVGALQQLGSDVDAGVGPIPVPDGRKLVRSPMNAGFPFAISSTARDKEAAAKVLEALVGPELQKALAADGNPPLSEDAWDSPEAKDNELLQEFRPTEEDEQWPKTPGGVLAVEGQTVDQAIASLVLDPSKDPGPVLQSLQERYQKAYDAGVEKGDVDPAEFTG